MSTLVVYPESDGKRMAENTLQYQWIVTIRENLARMFRDRPDVLIAADNLIYPVEGNPRITTAPDVYVAIGRPTRRRGSYRVWDEGGLFPQVVFEILSPSNTPGDMDRKRRFYQRYGAQEYFIYNPDHPRLEVWVRSGRRLIAVPDPHQWVSPLLQIRFDMSGDELIIYQPDGRPFLTMLESDRLAEQQLAQAARELAQTADERDKLRAKLRSLGIDPDAP